MDDDMIVVESCYPDAVVTPKSVLVELPFGSVPCALAVSVDRLPPHNVSGSLTSRVPAAHRKLLLNFLPSLCECCGAGNDTIFAILQTAEQIIGELSDEIEEDDRAISLSSLPVTKQQDNSPLVQTVYYSHHLIASSKRSLINALSKDLNLTGLVKVGWPGAILIEGKQNDVEEFTKSMKRLNWKHFAERGSIFVNGDVRSFSIPHEVESVSEFAAICRDSNADDLLDMLFPRR